VRRPRQLQPDALGANGGCSCQYKNVAVLLLLLPLLSFNGVRQEGRHRCETPHAADWSRDINPFFISQWFL
jgi:hypothetical protein